GKVCVECPPWGVAAIAVPRGMAAATACHSSELISLNASGSLVAKDIIHCHTVEYVPFATSSGRTGSTLTHSDSLLEGVTLHCALMSSVSHSVSLSAPEMVNCSSGAMPLSLV